MKKNPRLFRAGVVSAVLAALVIVIASALVPPAQPPSYTSPTPDPSQVAFEEGRVADPEAFVGARVTARANQVSDGVVRFDWTRYDSCACFDPAAPGELTLTQTGFWRIEAQVTVLGTGYRGAPVDDVVMVIDRVGDPSGFLVFDRVSGGAPDIAAALGGSTTDWYLAGERIELRVTEGITVEANWPGRSNVSPILVVTYLGR
jgi:hypothetical protein